METPLRRKVVITIRRIRRCEETAKNWAKLQRLVEENLEEIATTFSVRWIVSICDTYADHAGPVERRNAFMISLLVNMIRLSDTLLLTRGPMVPEQLEAMRGEERPALFSGVSCFHLDREDTLLNVAKRLTLMLEETPILLRLYRAVLDILHGSDNSITALKAIVAQPERVLPAEPLDIADNYGVTRPGSGPG